MQVICFDVKPANVLLDRSMKHAKLADVGLAKVLERSVTMTVLVRASSQPIKHSPSALTDDQSEAMVTPAVTSACIHLWQSDCWLQRRYFIL